MDWLDLLAVQLNQRSVLFQYLITSTSAYLQAYFQVSLYAEELGIRISTDLSFQTAHIFKVIYIFLGQVSKISQSAHVVTGLISDSRILRVQHQTLNILIQYKDNTHGRGSIEHYSLSILKLFTDLEKGNQNTLQERSDQTSPSISVPHSRQPFPNYLELVCEVKPVISSY